MTMACSSTKEAKLQAERERLRGLWVFEHEHPEATAICGIDEVGRGPLAGPVYAGAVILPPDIELLYLNDSKKLSEKKREALSAQIWESAVSCAVGYSSAARIDEIGIVPATEEAMAMAVSGLSKEPDLLLVDAFRIRLLDRYPQINIIKGDAKSASIAAASIIAKVARDRLMKELDGKYPGYGFAGHKGYGTRQHIEAIRRLGPCELHRRSFIRNIVG